jgi:hypothetical protein
VRGGGVNADHGTEVVRVVKVAALRDWRLAVEFSDGRRGDVSINDRLFGPAFEPLRECALFSQVAVGEFGAICWPNSADLAPDALHDRLLAQSSAA